MNRRKFLKISSVISAGYASGIGGYEFLEEKKINSNAQIVIVGSGTGGLTTAAKLTKRINGAKITIIDKNKKHIYQPGNTLIAFGVYQPNDVIRENIDYIPDGVRWLKEMVVEYDPDANQLVTDKGGKIQYDFLIIASGTQVNFSAIEGMDISKIGKNGIGSIYHSPENALRSLHELNKFLDTGGTGLFTKPATPIKCGGAPLKAAFLAESLAAATTRRTDFDIFYLTGKKSLFKVDEINKLCQKRIKEKNIEPHLRHTLKAIDPHKKLAYFKNKEHLKEFSYDYIHIVPPMSAADNIKNSPL